MAGLGQVVFESSHKLRHLGAVLTIISQEWRRRIMDNVKLTTDNL